MMSFELAREEDIDELMQILEQAKINMERQNIYQWNQQYPNRLVMLSDIEKEELYVLKDKRNSIVCMGTFSESPIKEMSFSAEESAIFIKRLTVKASACGQGLARELIDKYMNKYCLRAKIFYSATNHTNLPMQRLLEKMNFSVLETFVIKERAAYGNFRLYCKKVGDID